MSQISLIGFGEAGIAFAEGTNWAATALGYDRKTEDAATRDAKVKDFARVGVRPAGSLAEALADATMILSLVTADQALAAARAAATHLVPGALWCDCNSVAPATKQAAAVVIEAAGGRYVDVAVMSPVLPARRAAPLLVSGPDAGAAAAALFALGFSNVTIVAGTVGSASAIKMIRSVMIKGIEALSAECVLAAEAAGVRDAVIASLDESWPGADWASRFDYNLDRMLAHGLRRAAEMEEVVKTLEALGTGATMSYGTVKRQHEIGALGIATPDGLEAKLRLLHRLAK